MFNEERDKAMFKWEMLGDIEKGRPNLGPKTDVMTYRLMQYTLRDILIRDFGVERANRVLFEAGEHAGREFSRNVVKEREDLDAYVAELQGLLRDKGIGILRVEDGDPETMEYTVAVAEDLDCSGLPFTDECICTYDEGFLAGLFSEFTGRDFTAREVDCWCSGERVCRFAVKPKNGK